MIAKYIEIVSQFASAIDQGHVGALVALFLVITLGEFGVPFPFVLQGVLYFIGYQVTQGAVRVIPLVVILLLGRQFGSSIVYGSAHFLGDPFIDWLGKHSRPVRNEVYGIKGKLHPRASLVVALGRLTPGLLVPTSLASGVIGLRYGYFMLGVVLSAVLWDGTFIASGVLVGHGVQYLSSTASRWFVVVIVGVAIGLLWAGGQFLLRNKSHSANSEDRVK